MTEPLWGAHPHFAQFGLDHAFAGMLERCGDALDLVEVHFDGARQYRATPLREPDFTRPDNVPAGMTWLPNPDRRRAAVKLEEADPDGDVRRAIDALVMAMPYRGIRDRWPYGTPSLELGRNGASLKMPIEIGSLVIYTEGREKSLAPDRPYWTSLVSVYHGRRHVPDSDILAAGGQEAYVLEGLLNDPHLATPATVVPVDERRFTIGLMCIHLPLDTYVQEKNP